MLNFTIEIHRHGTLMQKFIVPAHESGIVGCYHDGKPYQPAQQPICALVDQRHVKAIKRASWVDFGLVDCLRLDLTSLNDAPMGTLIARANWK